ncbi:MAG: helix-turn-helix transcriptional regulator, partial [Clostridia bacterium]
MTMGEWLAVPRTRFAVKGLTLSEREDALPKQVPQGVLRLLCVNSGACTLHVWNKQIPLAGNRMALLCADTPYTVEQTEETLQSILDIALEKAETPLFAPGEMYQHCSVYYRYCQAAYPVLIFEDALDMVTSTLQNLRTFVKYGREVSARLCEISLDSLVLYILCAAMEDPQAQVAGSMHVRKAIRYMNEHYMHPIRAGDIAAYVGVHPNHLHRLFFSETGLHMTEYLTTWRMEKAKALLVDTDVPVSEVARRVGIPHAKYFSRLFHEATGRAPKDFRTSYNVTCDYTTARTEHM